MTDKTTADYSREAFKGSVITKVSSHKSVKAQAARVSALYISRKLPNVNSVILLLYRLAPLTYRGISNQDC